MRYCRACHRCFGDKVEFCLFDQTATREVESLPLIVEGKYRLEQLIAHGGMGSVYRATHLPLDRAVAIKILRPEFLADATARERFNREARAAARLKHPNIVSVYDSGHLPNGSAYLVMELVEGRSLREEMQAHAARLGQMRPERAAAILSQVCSGIEAAHRLGIIHRDLKPDNVMIEPPSSYGAERVLVLDFGIAKLALPAMSDLSESREQTWKGLTDENMIVGTPKYISPEQCTGQPVDARSDVYSLGVLLYEMLTGHAPFAGENTSIVLLKHLQEPPAPLRRFVPGISPELEQVVLRALAKQPQQRFSSAAEFAEHLLAAVESVSLLEPAPSVEAEENTMTAPRPVAATARPFQYSFEEQPAIEIEAPTLLIERRPRRKLFASATVVLLAAISSLTYFLYNDWQANADDASQQIALASSPTPGVLGKQLSQVSIENPDGKSEKQTVPAAFVKNEAAEEVELRAVYAEWTLAAVRGEWAKHAALYADRVEYFRDGALSRAKIEARKRAIFGKLDSYWLKFSDSPQIVLKDSEADMTFDRSWTLRRGRKQTSGRAQGSITLRREAKGWRIVSEKQIKK